MKRLLSAVKWDVNFQVRYGFYYAYAVITVLYIIILRQIPYDSQKLAVTFIIFSDPAILGFFFIGGLILLEKGEGTLEYIVATPLRDKEYLASKALSLTFLSMLTSLIIAVFAYGVNFNWLLAAIGVMLTSVFFIMIGFVAVARFKSVNEYLLSAFVYMIALNLPILDFLGIFKSPLFYINPTQASLILMKSAFTHVEMWKIVYALIYLILWIIIAGRWGYKYFYKFIILREGEK